MMHHKVSISPIAWWLALIAALSLGHGAHAHPVVWGGTPCTYDGTDVDGCYNGGSVQVPTFFKGYAAQSAGQSYPSSTATLWGSGFSASASKQPVNRVYVTRPPWNVAGVDFAVGMPRWQMPITANLHPAYLKDPAQIATDPLVNPNLDGANCKFYTSNSAVSGGVAAGSIATPTPFTWSGPGIYCSNVSGSTNPLIFDGYNFGWNSVTGFGCVPIDIAGRTWGTAAAHTSRDTAAIVVRNSLFVNGPNCNIVGSIAAGTGTASSGPQGQSYIVQLVSTITANTFAFYNNTVLGCGGDANAGALETALCSANWPGGTYTAGSVTVTGYAAGVAPFNTHLISDAQASGNSWIENNAFLHLTGRVIDYNNTNVGNTVHKFDHNYIEGMIYQPQPYVYFSSIVCSANCSSPSTSALALETVTATAPHGIPVGSMFTLILSSNGASGLAWNGTYTVTATDTTHLTLQSSTNPGDWTWSSGAYGLAYSNYGHGEVQYMGANIGGAVFNGTISGNTLTVNSLTSGTLAAGQYVTANSVVDAVINGSVSGTTLTVNSVTSGTVAIGQIVAGTGIPTGTMIVSGSGSTWTLSQPATAGSETINLSYTIPSPTYIVSGSGSTWTLNQSLTNPVGPTLMNSPYYTIGAQGGTTEFDYQYNTYLQPASTFGYGGQTVVYLAGAQNFGVPLQTFTGSIGHNVFVQNLSPTGNHRPTSVTAVSTSYVRFQTLAFTKNYLDPTGGYSCWQTLTDDPSTGLSMSGNVNLLNPSDPYINQIDSIGIVPYSSGANSDGQAENGVAYNPSTGVVTLTLSYAAPWVSVGQSFYIAGYKLSGGTDYLAGAHTVASVSGTSVTYNSGISGATGIQVSKNPTLSIYQPGSSTALQACYGHN